MAAGPQDVRLVRHRGGESVAAYLLVLIVGALLGVAAAVLMTQGWDLACALDSSFAYCAPATDTPETS